MKKRQGVGYPKFACEIQKYRDVLLCIRDNSLCDKEDWLVDRNKQCIAAER